MVKTLEAVDCQGFAGGFTCGVARTGFTLRGKREMPGGFGVASCEANRQILGDKWEAQVAPAAEWEPMDVPLVFGNPPCSGFSLLSRSDFRGSGSPINHCMHAFADYAARCRPEVAIFESVAQAFKQGRELMQQLRMDIEEKTGDQYELIHVLHNAASVGGAAVRKRYFFVVSRVPFGIEPHAVDRIPTFRQTIGDLEGLGLTWDKQSYRRPPSWWVKRRDLRSKTGATDGHYTYFTPLVQRALDLLTEVDWPEGSNISEVARRYYQKMGRLPSSWKSTEEKLIGNDFKMGFYQLHSWKYDGNCRVVTGAGTQLILHPTEQRPLTNREVARIQGFPDDWRIGPLRTNGGNSVGMLWGKGIPVQCGEWIAGWAKQAILGEPGGYDGNLIGERERLIDVTNDYQRARLG